MAEEGFLLWLLMLTHDLDVKTYLDNVKMNLRANVTKS